MKGLIVLIFVLVPSMIFAQRMNISDDNLIDLSGLWESKKTVNLSDVADSIDYIVLETNSNSYLSDFGEMEVFLFDDRIYVVPVKQNVKVFDVAGKYLFDIGNRGEGPSEYKRVKLLIDPDNETIWIIDTSLHKLLKYKMDGTYLSETPVGKYVSRLGLLENGQLVGLNLPIKNIPEKTELLYFDEKGGVAKTHQMYPDNEKGVGDFYQNDPLFGQINGKFHFAEMPFKEVVELSDAGNWELKWRIEAGVKMPKKNATTPSLSNTYITKLIETKDYFFIEGLNKRYFRFFIFDKVLGQTKATRVSMETENVLSDVYGLMNDMDGGLPFWPDGTGDQNRLISIINPLQLIDLIEGNVTYHYGKQKTPISIELKSLVTNLSLESNPVLMVVHLKEKTR